MSKLSLAALLLLFLVSRGDASEQCAPSLVGYDLGPLQEGDYWTFRVDNVKDCILPLGLTESDIDHCDILISVCRSLGNDTCPNHENSTTCQRVVPNNGDSAIYYDMGTYEGNDEFDPINGNITGFQTQRKSLDQPVSEECNATIIAFIDFICNPDSSWSDSNVTQFVVSATQLFDPCLYLIKFNYSGGCYMTPTLSPSHCSIGDYNTAIISSRDYWTATVPESACFGSDHVSCVMYLAFCHPVPPEVGDTCYNSAVCQKGYYSDDDTIQELSMGSFTNYTHFYENDEEGANGGFRMKVENGSKPLNGTICKDGLQTELILVCDKTKEWTSQDISDYLQLVYHEGNDPCMYVLKIGYSGACPSDSGNILSKYSPVGWIFIGLFAFAVIAYLVIGSAVMYFGKGERGVRVIPNYEFWKKFVIYTLEGCRFFLDIITCFQFDGRVPKNIRQPDYDKI